MFGSSESKEDEGNNEEAQSRWLDVLRRWMTWLGSLMGCVLGGFILVWWKIKYHSTNTQLWMVPFGLILFSMPLIVSCAVLSAARSNNKGSEVSRAIAYDAQGVINSQGPDPER